MKIDCIGCLHGHYPQLDGGDLLIITGDLLAGSTFRDDFIDLLEFFTWVAEKKYRKRIFIAGNHDEIFTRNNCKHLENIEYLCDSGTEFEGLKIWGSPWTSRFVGINPKCCAFTGENDKEIAPHFKKIPTDTDILITHGPPEGIMDMTMKGEHVGSPSLMKEHLTRIRPKLWVFSHIHEGYGQIGTPDRSETVYVNCSHMDEKYRAVNPPIRIEL